MSDSERVVAPAPAQSTKRAKTVGTIAIVSGVLAAVVGLVGVLSARGGMDPIDLLLFAGGMLVAVLGFRGLRRVRASKP
jgi:hypothetical protein